MTSPTTSSGAGGSSAAPRKPNAFLPDRVRGCRRPSRKHRRGKLILLMQLVLPLTEHALFECKTHDEIRAEFLGRVEKVYSPFGGMSTDARTRLLLADDTPKEIDSIFYRFLIQLFASRERGLASGPAGGRP